jgi:hypothetical protein
LTGILRDAREAEIGQLATKADIDRLAAAIDRVAAVTKADIDKLGVTTKTDIESLRAEMKAEFALIRSEMEVLRRDVTIRPGGMIVVATGVLLAVSSGNFSYRSGKGGI